MGEMQTIWRGLYLTAQDKMAWSATPYCQHIRENSMAAKSQDTFTKKRICLEMYLECMYPTLISYEGFSSCL
jgi:hypothetical protein